VALLDAGTFPRAKICGEYLSPECWDVFDRLDLSREIENTGFHPIHRVCIFDPVWPRRGCEFPVVTDGPVSA